MGLIKRLQAITFGIWLGIILIGNAFGGEIYSCVDKEGKKRIQNNPCISKGKTIDRQVFSESNQHAAPNSGQTKGSQNLVPAYTALHPSQAGYDVTRAGRPAVAPTGMEAAIAAQEKYDEGQRQAKLRAAEQAAASGPAWSAGNRYKAALGAFSNTGGNIDLPATPPRAAVVPKPIEPPPVIGNCDQAGCWDTSGKRYNRGAGPTFFRSDGKPCIGGPGFMNCN